MRGPRKDRLRLRHILLCLWPGLAQLWLGGEWWGLVLAFGFGCLVDLLLLTSLVWTGLVEPALRVAAWTAASVLWCASAAAAWKWCHEHFQASGLETPNRSLDVHPASQSALAEDLFPAVLREYLRGDWFETERLCRQLLEARPDDEESRLMLATVRRHTGRLEEARRELEKLAGTSKWAAEVAAELERVAELENPAKNVQDTERVPRMLGAA